MRHYSGGFPVEKLISVQQSFKTQGGGDFRLMVQGIVRHIGKYA